MRTRAFIALLLIITLTAVAAAWFWALVPITASFEVLGADTDADLVRQLFHFRLMQPEWVSKPPNYDYERWAEAETLARLSVVFLGLVVSIIFAYWKCRRKTLPNTALEPMPTAPLVYERFGLYNDYQDCGATRPSAWLSFGSLGGSPRMKTWLIILIGVVVGLLVGFSMFSANQNWDHWWISYPAIACINFLSHVFFPNQDMAGLFFVFPVLALYFAVIGVVIAFATRFLWRKFSV